MTPLTEKDAERHLAAHALTAAYPGFVGLTVDLPPTGPAGRSRLRHGFLIAEPGRTVVSGPPSPGLETAVARMTEDLELVAAPGSARGLRVSLEAGTEDHGPTGIRRRWAVAQSIAPVLAAAFGNSPEAGWRSTPRFSSPGPGDPRPPEPGRRLDPCTVLPAPRPGDPGPDPRTAWARQVLDAPVTGSAPATFRDWIRHSDGLPPGIADLERHCRGFRPPVAAHGHLEIDVVDRLPDDGWLVAAAVITTLIDDPQAATEALGATAGLRDTPYLWERAGRDALTDRALAVAARSLFLSAYGALARRGAPRQMRDALAAYLERYVLRGRCPADDPIKENRS